MKWSVNLFGAFRVTSPRGAAFQTKSFRLRVLLAYLAYQPTLRADRHAVHDVLFEQEDDPGGSGFRVLLARGVSALAALDSLTLVVSTHGDIGLLESNCDTDLKAFETHVERARNEPDPLTAALAWCRALESAQGRPFDDLEHPVLQSVRERLSAQVLDAAAHLAAGPLGTQSRTLLLDRIHAFSWSCARDAIAVEALMRIYAALGMKEELTQTFSDYESHLDFECGEKAPAALALVFDQLLAAMDQPRSSRGASGPDRPKDTIGRDDTLAALLQATQASEGPGRLTTLTGQSGIGKSHVLRALFWSFDRAVPVAHFDLEAQPAEVIGNLLSSNPCKVALIDHVQESHAPLVGQWMRAQPHVRFVCASHTRLGLPHESLMTLGPLPVGDLARPGPAISLLEKGIELVHHAAPSDALGSTLLFELADLCDGIPLALEIAGRLSGSIGLRATIGSLRRDLDGLTSDRQAATRKSSLRNAIASSYENLSNEARSLVAILATLGGRCHMDHLLECSDSVPCDLEEGILSGLIVREQRGTYVRVLRSTAVALEDALVAEPMAHFRLRSIAWFRARGADLPLDLEVAASLPLAVDMVCTLVKGGAIQDAQALFASLRPWLGSHPLAVSQLKPIERALLDAPHGHPDWPAALLTIAAAYFHTGDYGLMRDVLGHALLKLGPQAIASDEHCQLVMQKGLAEMGLGNIDGAIAMYQQVLEMAGDLVSDATLVKCYYNLGALFEDQNRLEESLKAHESASHHFSAETDPRVESLVNGSIGRLLFRLGGDLASAALILEATLAQARARQDRRAAAEILQNLGMIYSNRGLFAKAVAAECIGTAMLLEFGYNEYFRRLSKSSFVTLGKCLFEMGLDNLAHATRAMIDRLGDAAFYPPDVLVYEQLAARTYTHPSGLRLAIASETEVREHLLACLSHLHGVELPLGQPWEVAGRVLGGDPAPSRPAAAGAANAR